MTHYESWEELLEYSRYSANPVGRLVLWVSGYRQEEMLRALGQGMYGAAAGELLAGCGGGCGARAAVSSGGVDGAVRRGGWADLRAGVYAGVSGDGEGPGGADAGDAGGGRGDYAKVDAELAVTLTLFCKGGKAILAEIAAQDYDVLRGRPVVSKLKKAGLLLGAFAQKYGWGRRSRVVAG